MKLTITNQNALNILAALKLPDMAGTGDVDEMKLWRWTRLKNLKRIQPVIEAYEEARQDLAAIYNPENKERKDLAEKTRKDWDADFKVLYKAQVEFDASQLFLSKIPNYHELPQVALNELMGVIVIDDLDQAIAPSDLTK